MVKAEAVQKSFGRLRGARVVKCRERHDSFLDSGLPDSTDYADATYVRS